MSSVLNHFKWLQNMRWVEDSGNDAGDAKRRQQPMTGLIKAPARRHTFGHIVDVSVCLSTVNSGWTSRCFSSCRSSPFLRQTVINSGCWCFPVFVSRSARRVQIPAAFPPGRCHSWTCRHPTSPLPPCAHT